MIRIIFFMLLLGGLFYLIYQLFAWLKYRKSMYYKIDQDVEKLAEETKKYKQEAINLENKKRDLWQSFSAIKYPPDDVKELYELRSAVIEKEIKLYKKIINLYEQYKEVLQDKAKVLRFKAKHGNESDTTDEISDALFQVEQMRNEIKTNLKISYYDQISGPTELTDLRGSLKHLEEMEGKSKVIGTDTPLELETEIQDDFLILKELVRQKL
jgi:hypothetical protein